MIKPRSGPRAALRRLRIRLLPVPSQAFGLAVLIAVLAAALVSAPLMIASAEQAAWDQELARVGQNGMGVTFGSSTLAGRQVSETSRVARIGELDDAVIASVAEAGLNAPVSLARLYEPILTAPPHGFSQVQMVYSTGSADAVEIVAGAASDSGVLVPEELAEDAGVGPGDVLTVQGERGDRASVQVSGVYVTPTLPLDPYWEGLGYLFLPTLTPLGELQYPPAAILASKDVTLATALAVDEDVQASWLVPVDDGVDITGARTAAGRLRGAPGRHGRPGVAGHPADRPARASRARRRTRRCPARSRRWTAPSACSPRRCGPWASAAASPPWSSSARGRGSGSAVGTASCAPWWPAACPPPAGPGRPPPRPCCRSCSGWASAARSAGC